MSSYGFCVAYMSDFIEFDPDGDEVINREVIEHQAPATDRSQARRIALQALYEIDSSSHKVGGVLNHLLAQRNQTRRVNNYGRRIVLGVHEQLAAVDGLLQSYASEWPIDQVALVDRNILRIAVYELAIEKRLPVGVVIDEAVELAKLFGADNTPRFINGVLGALADNLETVRSTFGASIIIEDDDEHDEDADDNHIADVLPAE